jgi:hypothetical protein
VALALCLLSCGSGEEPQDTGPVEFECGNDCSLHTAILVGGDQWFRVHGLRAWVPHTVRSLSPEVMTASATDGELVQSGLCIFGPCGQPHLRVSAHAPGEARILIENDRGIRAELRLRAAVEEELSLTVWRLGNDDIEELEPSLSGGAPRWEVSTGDVVVASCSALDENGDALNGRGIEYRSTAPTILDFGSSLWATAAKPGLADLVASTATSEYRFGFAVVTPRESPPEALPHGPPWGTRPAP